MSGARQALYLTRASQAQGIMLRKTCSVGNGLGSSTYQATGEFDSMHQALNLVFQRPRTARCAFTQRNQALFRSRLGRLAYDDAMLQAYSTPARRRAIIHYHYHHQVCPH